MGFRPPKTSKMQNDSAHIVFFLKSRVDATRKPGNHAVGSKKHAEFEFDHQKSIKTAKNTILQNDSRKPWSSSETGRIVFLITIPLYMFLHTSVRGRSTALVIFVFITYSFITRSLTDFFQANLCISLEMICFEFHIVNNFVQNHPPDR